MQHTILEFNNCLPLFFTCTSHERGREKDKDTVKSMIAVMHRGLTCDSACGTACLFNLARMWIMRGKIPSIRLRGPSQCRVLGFLSRSSEPFLYQGRTWWDFSARAADVGEFPGASRWLLRGIAVWQCAMTSRVFSVLKWCNQTQL